VVHDEGPVLLGDRVERLSGGRWQVGEERPVEIDGSGTPVLEDGQNWPLERD